jgi:hypothetical protein
MALWSWTGNKPKKPVKQQNYLFGAAGAGTEPEENY